MTDNVTVIIPGPKPNQQYQMERPFNKVTIIDKLPFEMIEFTWTQGYLTHHTVAPMEWWNEQPKTLIP